MINVNGPLMKITMMLENSDWMREVSEIMRVMSEPTLILSMFSKERS